MKNDLYNHNKYLFIFSHPDDEIYCCCLMKKLLNLGKKVDAVFVTSGDYQLQNNIREYELMKSMKIVGIGDKNIHLLKINQRKILDSINTILVGLLNIEKKLSVDCIIGQDYEGGHNGHDAISFVTQELVKKIGNKDFYVFPAYWGKPEKRKGAMFKPERTDFITINCSNEEAHLKIKIKETHSSQKSFFDKIEKSSPNYLNLLCSREVFFKVKKEINFQKKPTKEIGYDFDGRFTFEKFQEALKKYYKN